MGLEKKITFLRDKSQESAKISKLLTEKKIKFIEVYSNSRLTPYLMVQNSIYSIKGYNQIANYIKTYKKK